VNYRIHACQGQITGLKIERDAFASQNFNTFILVFLAHSPLKIKGNDVCEYSLTDSSVVQVKL